MTYAWQRAKEAWEDQHTGIAFEDLVGRYISEGGYVYSAPDLFVLAMPVRKSTDGRCVHDDEEGDAWFLKLAALSSEASQEVKRIGPTELLARFMKLAPYALPYVIWERQRSNRLHRYKWDQLEARFAHIHG
jgi:hypothetical protein